MAEGAVRNIWDVFNNVSEEQGTDCGKKPGEQTNYQVKTDVERTNQKTRVSGLGSAGDKILRKTTTAPAEKNKSKKLQSPAKSETKKLKQKVGKASETYIPSLDIIRNRLNLKTKSSAERGSSIQSPTPKSSEKSETGSPAPKSSEKSETENPAPPGKNSEFYSSNQSTSTGIQRTTRAQRACRVKNQASESVGEGGRTITSNLNNNDEHSLVTIGDKNDALRKKCDSVIFSMINLAKSLTDKSNKNTQDQTQDVSLKPTEPGNACDDDDKVKSNRNTQDVSVKKSHTEPDKACDDSEKVKSKKNRWVKSQDVSAKKSPTDQDKTCDDSEKVRSSQKYTEQESGEVHGSDIQVKLRRVSQRVPRPTPRVLQYQFGGRRSSKSPRERSRSPVGRSISPRDVPKEGRDSFTEDSMVSTDSLVGTERSLSTEAPGDSSYLTNNSMNEESIEKKVKRRKRRKKIKTFEIANEGTDMTIQRGISSAGNQELKVEKASILDTLTKELRTDIKCPSLLRHTARKRSVDINTDKDASHYNNQSLSDMSVLEDPTVESADSSILTSENNHDSMKDHRSSCDSDPVGSPVSKEDHVTVNQKKANTKLKPLSRSRTLCFESAIEMEYSEQAVKSMITQNQQTPKEIDSDETMTRLRSSSGNTTTGRDPLVISEKNMRSRSNGNTPTVRDPSVKSEKNMCSRSNGTGNTPTGRHPLGKSERTRGTTSNSVEHLTTSSCDAPLDLTNCKKVQGKPPRSILESVLDEQPLDLSVKRGSSVNDTDRIAVSHCSDLSITSTANAATSSHCIILNRLRESISTKSGLTSSSVSNTFQGFNNQGVLHHVQTRKVSPVLPCVRGKPIAPQSAPLFSHESQPVSKQSDATHKLSQSADIKPKDSTVTKVRESDKLDYSVFSVKGLVTRPVIGSGRTPLSNMPVVRPVSALVTQTPASSDSSVYSQSCSISGSMISSVKPVNQQAGSSKATVLNVPMFQRNKSTYDTMHGASTAVKEPFLHVQVPEDSRSSRSIPTAHVKPHTVTESTLVNKGTENQSLLHGPKRILQEMLERPPLHNLTDTILLSPGGSVDGSGEESQMPVLSPYRGSPIPASLRPKPIHSPASSEGFQSPPNLTKHSPVTSETLKTKICGITPLPDLDASSSKQESGSELKDQGLEDFTLHLEESDSEHEVHSNRTDDQFIVSKATSSPIGKQEASSSMLENNDDPQLEAFMMISRVSKKKLQSSQSFYNPLAVTYSSPQIKRYRSDIGNTRYFLHTPVGKHYHSSRRSIYDSPEDCRISNALFSAFPDMTLTTDWREDLKNYKLHNLRIPESLVSVPKKIPPGFMKDFLKTVAAPIAHNPCSKHQGKKAHPKSSPNSKSKIERKKSHPKSPPTSACLPVFSAYGECDMGEPRFCYAKQYSVDLVTLNLSHVNEALKALDYTDPELTPCGVLIKKEIEDFSYEQTDIGTTPIAHPTSYEQTASRTATITYPSSYATAAQERIARILKRGAQMIETAPKITIKTEPESDKPKKRGRPKKQPDSSAKKLKLIEHSDSPKSQKKCEKDQITKVSKKVRRKLELKTVFEKTSSDKNAAEADLENSSAKPDQISLKTNPSPMKSPKTSPSPKKSSKNSPGMGRSNNACPNLKKLLDNRSNDCSVVEKQSVVSSKSSPSKISVSPKRTPTSPLNRSPSKNRSSLSPESPKKFSINRSPTLSRQLSDNEQKQLNKKRKKRGLLAELENTDGFIAEKQMRHNESLFTDASQLTREERALQRAMMQFSEMEVKKLTKKKWLERRNMSSPQKSSCAMKADQLKRKAVRGHKAAAMGPEMIKQKFDDFKPQVLRARTRLQAQGNKGSKFRKYHKDDAVERAWNSDEQRREIMRVKRFEQENQTETETETKTETKSSVYDFQDDDNSSQNGDNETSYQSAYRLAINRKLFSGQTRGRQQSYGQKQQPFSHRRRGRGGRSYNRTLQLRNSIFATEIQSQIAVDVTSGETPAWAIPTSSDSKSSSTFSPNSMKKGLLDDDAASMCSSTPGDGVKLYVPPEVRKIAVCRETGETILHKATRMGYYEVVLWCCQTSYVDVNARDYAGFAALHETCVSENVEIARVLLEHGADVNVASRQDGIRPLHDAIERDLFDLARLFLAWGADPTLSTYSGKTTLMIAKSRDMKHFVKSYFMDLNGACEMDSLSEWDLPPQFTDPVDTHIAPDGSMDTSVDCGLFIDVPSDDDEVACDMIVFDMSEKPMPLSYLLCLNPGSRPRNFVPLAELLKRLRINEDDFHRIYPHVHVTKCSGSDLDGPEAEYFKSNSMDQILKFVEFDQRLKTILNIQTEKMPFGEGFIDENVPRNKKDIMKKKKAMKSLKKKPKQGKSTKPNGKPKARKRKTSPVLNEDSPRSNNKDQSIGITKKLNYGKDESCGISKKLNSSKVESRSISKKLNSSKDVILIDSADEVSECSIATMEYEEDNEDTMFAYTDCKGCSSREMSSEEDESTISVNPSSLASPVSSVRSSGQNDSVTGHHNSAMSVLISPISPPRRSYQSMISLLSGKQINLVSPESSPVKQPAVKTNQSLPQMPVIYEPILVQSPKGSGPTSVFCEVLQSEPIRAATSNKKSERVVQRSTRSKQRKRKAAAKSTVSISQSDTQQSSPQMNSSTGFDPTSEGRISSEPVQSKGRISSEPVQSKGRISPEPNDRIYHPVPQPLFVIEPDSPAMMDLPIEGATAEQSFHKNKSSPNPRSLLRSVLCRSSLEASANCSDVDPASDNEYGLKIAQVRTLSGSDAKEVFWSDSE